ncbi:saccharopine dehydrogenase [Hyaloraphidium curvatum]|nr:saccharopine dehydrogenase [Hyaloraphidium curvatum]
MPAPAVNSDRPLDLIVHGATGYTGVNVLEYLAKHGPRDLRWGISGRSKVKLEELKAKVEATAPHYDVRVITADASDKESVRSMVSQAQIVLACAGPFTKVGTPVVEACAETGTHYADITGETPWVHDMIQRFGPAAERTGALLVPFSGFDSVPSDLGAFLVAEKLAQGGERTVRVNQSLWAVKGGISAGTMASGLELTKEGVLDAYLLNPEGDKSGPDQPLFPLFFYQPALGRWQAPNPMSLINTRVVRRTQSLLSHRHGRFSYLETVSMPAIPVVGFLAAMWIGWGFLWAALFAAFAPVWVKKAVQSWIPVGKAFGVEDEGGFFVNKLIGTGEKGGKVVLTWRGTSDPGYRETPLMLVESALCLIKDRDRIPAVAEGRCGFQTPASAFGHVLAERLEKAGVKLEFAAADGVAKKAK